MEGWRGSNLSKGQQWRRESAKYWDPIGEEGPLNRCPKNLPVGAILHEAGQAGHGADQGSRVGKQQVAVTNLPDPVMMAGLLPEHSRPGPGHGAGLAS